LTETLKIRVVDEDILVTEEYYFAYFNDVARAFKVIDGIWDKYMKREKGLESTDQQPSSTRGQVGLKAIPGTTINQSIHSQSSSFGFSSPPRLNSICTQSPPRKMGHRRSMYDTTALSALPIKPATTSTASSQLNEESSDKASQKVPPVVSVMNGSLVKDPHFQDGIIAARSMLESPARPRPVSPLQRANTSNSIVNTQPSPSPKWAWSSGDWTILVPSRGLLHKKSLSDVGHNNHTAINMEPVITELQHAEFQKIFALADSERLIAGKVLNKRKHKKITPIYVVLKISFIAFTCYLVRVIPRLGKIYISENYVCFKSKIAGIKTKAIIPVNDITQIQKDKNGTGFFYSGLSIIPKDQNEVKKKTKPLLNFNFYYFRYFLSFIRLI
jgi:hypothetical protein